MTPLQRFTRKVDKSGNCWMWRGAIARTGYGKFFWNGKHTSPHRFSYATFVGPIPAGFDIDHLCRNRACCNPEHLEAVTRRENLLRGTGFQAMNAKKTHCPQGHAYSPENTYLYPDGRRRCIACRRISDMRPAPVARRAKYKRKHVPDADKMLAA